MTNSVHPIFGPVLSSIQHIPAAVAAATVEITPAGATALAKETPRCTRHSWREQPLDEPYPDHATYRHCTRCGIDYDEIEAEVQDLTCENATLNADLNAETERANLAEEQAKLNAHTVAQQQAEIRRLNVALALANRKNERIERRGDLQAALLEYVFTNFEQIVFTDGERPVRGWTLFENEQFADLAKHLVALTAGGAPVPRMVCPGCWDADCEGCKSFDVREPVLPKRLANLMRESRS